MQAISKHTCLTTLLVIAASAANLTAQLTLSAVAAGVGFTTGIGGPYVLPGTNITAGVPAGWTTMQVDHTTEASTVTLWTSVIGHPQAGTLASEGTVDLHYTSARPMFVDVALNVLVDFPRSGTGSCSFAQARTAYSMELLGHGTATYHPRVLVDATGITIRMRTFASASAGGPCNSAADMRCQSVVRASACDQHYGTACGITLQATPQLDGPGSQRLRITDPRVLPFGVLFVGASRLAAPLPWNCTLYCDFFAAVPVHVDAVTGYQEFGVEFPPGTWTMQAATFGGTTIQMSDGVEFVCP